MKKLLFILAPLLIITSCRSQVRSEKELVQVKTFSDVFVEPEALEYKHYFSEAVSQPNTPVLAKTITFFKLETFFEGIETIEKNFIIYNEDSNTISSYKETEKKEERSYLIILIAISILFFLILNILHKKYALYKNYKIFFIIAICFAFSCFFIISTLLVQPVIAISFIITLFVIHACFGSLMNSEKGSKIVKTTYLLISLGFYVLMVLGLLLLFER